MVFIQNWVKTVHPKDPIQDSAVWGEERRGGGENSLWLTLINISRNYFLSDIAEDISN